MRFVLFSVLCLLLPLPVSAAGDGTAASGGLDALALARAEADSRPEDAAAWLALSCAQLAAGLSDEAVDSARRAAARSPRWMAPHLALAEAYRARIPDSGRYRQLILARQIRESLEAAVALESLGAEAHLALMRFHLRAPALVGGSRRTAANLLETIVERDPIRGMLAQGLLALETGDPAAALGHLRRAEARVPRAGALRRQVVATLGDVLVGQRDWSAAQRLYERSVTIDPGFAEAWFGLGSIAAETGERLDAGAEALRRFLELPDRAGLPGPEQAHFRLGQIYAHMAHAERARDQFRMALAIDPDLGEARDALESL